MFFVRQRLALALVAASFAAVAGADELSVDSPFSPKGNGTVNSEQSSQGRYELVGMIATSKQTLVGLTDKTSHHSVWIPAGKISEGVEIVSCDPKQDRAVIRVDGMLQTLVMHASSPNGIGSLPHPSGPIAVPPPQVATGPQAQQEQEARMLVSDLLEISQQQRKAYEDSKKNGGTPSVTPAAH